MSWYIAHSAKGSSWKDPKYVKKEGTSGKMEETGVYYYPDDYKGGRHLPKGDKNRKKVKYDSEAYKKREFGNGNRTSMDEWERKVHEHVDKIIASNPEIFKSGADVARGIMNESNLDAVKNTLKAMGVSTDSMPDDQIKQLRSKIASYYDKNTSEGKESKDSKSSKSKKEDNESDSKKSSSKKKTSKKSSKKSETTSPSVKKESDSDETKFSQTEYRKKNRKIMYEARLAANKNKRNNKKRTVRSRSTGVQMSGISIIDEDYLAHHGILGMKWGRRNGPPYPLGVGDHSASERKAGWRKSLTGGSSVNKASDLSDDELKRRVQRMNLEKQYTKLSGKSDLEKAREAVDLSANSLNRLNNSINTNSKPKKKRMNLEKMTDKELRDRINREYLEMQYSDLFGEDAHPYVERGKKIASIALKGATIYLSLASTGLGIAYLISRL